MGTKPESCADALFDELIGYGLRALPDPFPGDIADDPDAIVEAILLAEYGDPTFIERVQRESLREAVCDWLFDGGSGRGTRSGLPRFSRPV